MTLTRLKLISNRINLQLNTEVMKLDSIWGDGNEKGWLSINTAVAHDADILPEPGKKNATRLLRQSSDVIISLQRLHIIFITNYYDTELCVGMGVCL